MGYIIMGVCRKYFDTSTIYIDTDEDDNVLIIKDVRFRGGQPDVPLFTQSMCKLEEPIIVPVAIGESKEVDVLVYNNPFKKPVESVWTISRTIDKITITVKTKLGHYVPDTLMYELYHTFAYEKYWDMI